MLLCAALTLIITSCRIEVSVGSSTNSSTKDREERDDDRTDRTDKTDQTTQTDRTTTSDSEDNIYTIPAENNTETNEIVVPSFLGMTLEEVLAEYSGFNLKIIREHDSAPVGLVIYQSIGAGATISLTQEIKLTVSMGSQMEEIDDFSSRPMDEVLTQLRNQGFYTKTVFVNDDTVPINYVIVTDPPAGSRVEVGATVTVYISSGPAV